MAKVPSMTTAECEAALGPRGALVVNYDNRRIVRKWLNSQGFPSLFSGLRTLKELQTAYNDVSGVTLAHLKNQMAAEGTNTVAAALADDEDDAADDFANAGGKIGATVSASAPTPVASGAPAVPGIDPRMAAIIAAAMAALPPAVDVAAIEKTILESCAIWLEANAMKAADIQALIAKEVPQHVATIKIEVKTPAVLIKTEGPRHFQFPELLETLADGLHVFMTGSAGSGKTTAVEQAFAALGKRSFICGAMSGDHKAEGFEDAYGKYRTTPMREAFEHGGGICFDEADAGAPDAWLSVNAALANGYMAFPDQPLPVKKHVDFQAVATANTTGQGADRVYVGRNQLDGATLDRFWFMDWQVDEKLERMVALEISPEAGKWVDRVQSLRRGAKLQKARMIISPRASFFGAKRIASGATFAKCEAALIWKGCDDALRSRIEQSAKDYR